MSDPKNNQTGRVTKRKGSATVLTPLQIPQSQQPKKSRSNPRLASKGDAFAKQELNFTDDEMKVLTTEIANKNYIQSEYLLRSYSNPPSPTQKAESAEERTTRLSNKLAILLTTKLLPTDTKQIQAIKDKYKTFQQKLSKKFQQSGLTSKLIDKSAGIDVNTVARRLYNKTKPEIDDQKINEVSNRLAALGDTLDVKTQLENKNISGAMDSFQTGMQTASNNPDYANAACQINNASSIEELANRMCGLFIDSVKQLLSRHKGQKDCGTAVRDAHSRRPLSSGEDGPGEGIQWSQGGAGPSKRDRTDDKTPSSSGDFSLWP